MLTTHTLGLPRIGSQRKLKFTTESFWRSELDEAGLIAVGCGPQLR